MLRLELGPLARLKAHRAFALEEPWNPMEVGGETITFVGPVRAHGEVERMHAGAHVHGQADLTIRQRCGRCLDPFDEAMTVPFEVFFSETARADEERGDAWEDDEVAPYHEEVDLTPWIEESVVLALPVRPLCAEDCPGLCPVCGTRRDRGCTCEPDDAAPPRLGRLGLAIVEAQRHAGGAGDAAGDRIFRSWKETGGPGGKEHHRHLSVRKGT
jgi:uncharacterized protein